MSDPDPRPGPPTVSGPDPRTPSPFPDDAPSFLLVFNDPAAPVAGYGLGWNLTAWHGRHRSWSLPLAGRGAGAGAGGRIAQGVALRVLGERGVLVTGWNTTTLTSGTDGSAAESLTVGPGDVTDAGGPATLGAFRARLAITVGTTAAPTRGH